MAVMNTVTAADTGNHPDAMVLEQLRKHGSNLSKPHLIDFHFYYFKAKRSAEGLATTLKTRGFSVRITHSAMSDDWTVVASKSLVPDFKAIAALSEEFETMAKAWQGKYDGWETQVVE